MKTTDPSFEVHEARPGTGKGLFAHVPFGKGEFIIEYIGVRISTKKANEHPGRYLFEIEGTPWTIDGEPSSSPARFINHSCDPNVEARVEEEHINLYAIRDIAPGEEITIDYGQEYFEEFIRPIGCKCAAKVHRR